MEKQSITFERASEKMHEAFLHSALSDSSLHSMEDFNRWLEGRREAHTFKVEKKPLSTLQGWRVEPDTGNIVHNSGRFFQIIGLEIETNFGGVSKWNQPIINQPEIGILGFLTKKINGVLHFLVQAKMEPGNVNLLQISPTLQATRSNFTQVHGGKKPHYLEYFLNCDLNNILVDQLQSEQGARFLRKRNRNMIIEVSDSQEIEIHPDFFWLTLAQIHDLFKVENLVNMDSRTVLSGIRYYNSKKDYSYLLNNSAISTFHRDVLQSALAGDDAAMHDIDAIVRWFNGRKMSFELSVKEVPIKSLTDWVYDGNTISHSKGRYFSVIGVSVTATAREVSSWEQPLIESAKGGVICFFCQKINGILHFLVQARVEPGNFDAIEMAPTLQATPQNYNPNKPESFPPFYELFLNRKPEQMRYDSLHSEEGGRFYHDQNRYMIIEVDEGQIKNIPANYFWITMRQAKEIIRFNNYLNIEARSLIACIGLAR